MYLMKQESQRGDYISTVLSVERYTHARPAAGVLCGCAHAPSS